MRDEQLADEALALNRELWRRMAAALTDFARGVGDETEARRVARVYERSYQRRKRREIKAGRAPQ